MKASILLRPCGNMFCGYCQPCLASRQTDCLLQEEGSPTVAWMAMQTGQENYGQRHHNRRKAGQSWRACSRVN